MNKAEALNHFKRALEWMDHSDYKAELERVKKLSPELVSREYFFSTYAHVVLAAGFRWQILETLRPRLEMAFRNYNIEAIAASPDEVTQAALRVINHPGKIGAILSMAKRLATEDWPTFKAKLIGQNHLAFIQSLPWIGPITKYHLARNIGFDYPKPDRLMERVAGEFGYGGDADGVFVMVKDIADATNTRPGVIDIILWRYEERRRPHGGSGGR